MSTNMIANNNTQVLDFDAFFANALAYQQQPNKGGAPLDLDAFAAQLQSCTGMSFVRNESAPLTVADWPEPGGAASDVRIVWWTTLNFKGEVRAAAAVLLVRASFSISSSSSSDEEEKVKEEEWVARTLFITTCDPFGLDNFTQPLGLLLHPLPTTTPRAHWDQLFKKVALCNTVKTVEQRVFLEGKARDHIVANAAMLTQVGEPALQQALQERITTSPFISSEGIREILGAERASGVPTAESQRLLRPAGISSLMTEEEFEVLKKAEKAALRVVAAALKPAAFYALYDSWLRYVASEMPLNLFPAEYKKRGRWLLLSREEAARWDRRVFLYLLGARTEVITESPYEASLWLALDAGCTIVEVSDDDARFGYKTPAKGRKLGEMIADFLANPCVASSSWLLATSAQLALQQGAFMARLAASLAAGDFEAALYQLTEGTADPLRGQGLLGLSEVLLRELTARRVVFPDALLEGICTYLANDAWTLPLLAVPTTTTADASRPPAHARLLLIGMPAAEAV